MSRHLLAWQVMGFMGLQSLTYYTALSWLPTMLRDRGAGAVFGGLTGAMIGSASDANRAQQNQAQMSEAQQEQAVAMADKATDYRRALSACLEGRGYSVK